jgi:anaerobic selenocysteine-containing dehydrogenase
VFWEWWSLSEEYEIKRIICINGMGGCLEHCGLLAYIDKKTGRLVKVEGNPEHPFSKGFVCQARRIAAEKKNWPASLLYHPNQLLYPLKRIGERGEGKWQQISYEQALDEISAKLKELMEKYGPECIGFVEGTYRADAFLVRSRLASALGNPLNMTAPATVCHHNNWCLEQIMIGACIQSTPMVSEKTRLLVGLGVNLPENLPHAWNIITQFRRNLKLVVVDPRTTEMARDADIHLQNRPGTDGVLVLSWIKVLIDEGMYDKDFLKEWTNAPFLVRTDERKLLRETDINPNGLKENFVVWDEKAKKVAIWKSRDFEFEPKNAVPALTGAYEVSLANGKRVECKTVWQMFIERVSKYTPEYAEEITWIPAEKIVETAKLLWTHRPGGLAYGVALCQTGSDNRWHMALVTLALMTNNLDIEGGQVLGRHKPGPVINGRPFRESMYELQELLTPEVKKKQLGYNQFRMASWLGFDKYNEHYKRVWGVPQASGSHTVVVTWPLFARAILEGKPYPLKALIVWGGNPMMWAPNTKKVYKTLKSPNLELLVVLEHWMTPTAALADYIIPAACKLLEYPYACNLEDTFDILWVGEGAVKPLGERRSDFEFFKDLADRLGVGKYLPWKNVEEYERVKLQEMLDLTLEEAAQLGALFSNTPGYLMTDFQSYAYVDPKTGKPRGFATPSGKAEIWSSIIEELGYDPLPTYIEPPESPISTPEVAKEYPLILTTGGRFQPMFHSEYRQWGMGFREQHPWPICDIHYNTARELGIVDGDWVWIETRRGRILQKARVGPHIHPKVVNVQASWWYPELPPEEPWLCGAFISNANMLTLDDPETLCPMYGNWWNRALLCKVYKAKPEDLQMLPISIR